MTINSENSGRKNELLTNCRARPEISTTYTAPDAHVESVEISRIISIALIIYTITSHSCKRGFQLATTYDFL